MYNDFRKEKITYIDNYRQKFDKSNWIRYNVIIKSVRVISESFIFHYENRWNKNKSCEKLMNERERGRGWLKKILALRLTTLWQALGILSLNEPVWVDQKAIERKANISYYDHGLSLLDMSNPWEELLASEKRKVSLENGYSQFIGLSWNESIVIVTRQEDGSVKISWPGWYVKIIKSWEEFTVGKQTCRYNKYLSIFTDSTVSRYHCTISLDDQGVVYIQDGHISDYGEVRPSTNGTYLLGGHPLKIDQ